MIVTVTAHHHKLAAAAAAAMTSGSGSSISPAGVCVKGGHAQAGHKDIILKR